MSQEKIKSFNAEETVNLVEGVVPSKAMIFTTENSEDTEKDQLRGKSQFL